MSAPSPEKPNFGMQVHDRIGGMSAVIAKRPAANPAQPDIELTSLVGDEATNFPSGEISAPPSEPVQSVNREKV
jgi:hypothetical protein